MTKCSSWYTKGIFVKLVMSFIKAAEVVKALRWAEFRSVLEVARCIQRALLDFTEKSYFWASSVKKLKKKNNLFSAVLRTRQESIQLSLHMLIPKQWYPQQTQKYLFSNLKSTTHGTHSANGLRDFQEHQCLCLLNILGLLCAPSPRFRKTSFRNDAPFYPFAQKRWWIQAKWMPFWINIQNDDTSYQK